MLRRPNGTKALTSNHLCFASLSITAAMLQFIIRDCLTFAQNNYEEENQSAFSGRGTAKLHQIAPLHKVFNAYTGLIEHKICHTGQHYDASMSDIFFKDLEMPQPSFFLNAGVELMQNKPPE